MGGEDAGQGRKRGLWVILLHRAFPRHQHKPTPVPCMERSCTQRLRGFQPRWPAAARAAAARSGCSAYKWRANARGNHQSIRRSQTAALSHVRASDDDWRAFIGVSARIGSKGTEGVGGGGGGLLRCERALDDGGGWNHGGAARNSVLTRSPIASSRSERLHLPVRRRGGTIGWPLLSPSQHLGRDKT